MKQRNLVWALLLMVAITPLSAALGGAEPAEVIPAAPQAEPPVASPAEPEKDSGLEAELPELFIQEPNFVCYAGWCSNNTQCEEWVGPGSTCQKPKGAGCGQCTIEA